MTSPQGVLFAGERVDREHAGELWRLWTEASRETRAAFLDRIRRDFLERAQAKRKTDSKKTT